MSFFKKLIPLKAEMRLQPENLDVKEGEPLKGLASLESREKFKVESVRLEIRVKETYWTWRTIHTSRGTQSSRSKVTQTLYSRDVPIAESFDMANGDKRDLPFEVTIPMYQPTRGQITYSLKAVANVKGRPDITKEVKLL